MKTTRLITMLLASLALSTSAFAADAAIAFSLKGEARVKKGEGYTRIAVGNGIEEGSFIQVGANSSLGLKTVDGGTLFFGPNSSFRLKYIPDSGPGHTALTLLSGSVSGVLSGVTVTTSAGVVSGSGIGTISFSPSTTGGGELTLSCVTGSMSITAANGSVITIPVGSQYTPTGGVQVMTLAQRQAASRVAVDGVFDGVRSTQGRNLFQVSGQTGPATNNVPNLSVVSVVSPNGEGQQP